MTVNIIFKLIEINAESSECLTTTPPIFLMNDVSAKFSDKAYASFSKGDYEYALELCNVLLYLNYVPTELKKNAITNVEVVEGYVKEIII